ncbi:MAG: hypothetical protein GY909_18215 [Oligoflexia bacterium]|nr:hypothetical protein [Oligoflexia bacterium]
MIKNRIFILLILFVTSLEAKWDFKLEQLARSYPTGFYLKSNVGYSLNFWEKDKKALYGYGRIAAEAQTSFVVNTASVIVDFNPISFVNLFGGLSKTNRNISDISSFSCELVTCRGKLDRSYYGYRLALGAGKFFLMGETKYTNIELTTGNNRLFVDELSSTLGSPNKDRLEQHTLALGYSSIMTLSQFNRMNNTNQKSQMHYLLYRKFFNKELELKVGPGFFRSRVQDNHFSIISLLTWNIKAGPLLSH